MLYASARRAWRDIGGQRIVSYTLATEAGTSLLAAGWWKTGTVPIVANPWGSKNGRQRKKQPVYDIEKTRWEGLTQH